MLSWSACTGGSPRCNDVAVRHRMRRSSAGDQWSTYHRSSTNRWAQVNGREDIDWAQRFVLDRWYVDHWSPALDLRILWRTATSLQRGEPPVHVDQLNIQRRQAHDVRRAT